MNIKKDLDQKSYIIHAIHSYLNGEKLEVFFPNKPIGKIQEIIDQDRQNVSDKTISEIERLVF